MSSEGLTRKRRKSNLTDPFENVGVDLKSEKQPAVIKRDKKLRKENDKFVVGEMKNNITQIKMKEGETSKTQMRRRWAVPSPMRKDKTTQGGGGEENNKGTKRNNKEQTTSLEAEISDAIDQLNKR